MEIVADEVVITSAKKHLTPLEKVGDFIAHKPGFKCQRRELLEDVGDNMYLC
jgi:hypothetical protein